MAILIDATHRYDKAFEHMNRMAVILFDPDGEEQEPLSPLEMTLDEVVEFEIQEFLERVTHPLAPWIMNPITIH